MKPNEIEQKSFQIIDEELKNIYKIDLPKETEHIVKRVIHTTAEFEYAKNLYFSDGFSEAVKKVLKEGPKIVTDTSMAMAGINKTALKKYDGCIKCFMQDETVAKEAKERQTTRAYVSMEYAAREFEHPVFVVGNAPTALFSIYDLYEKGLTKPDLVIAAPVGFVNVTEAKELIEKTDIPMVVARGRRGGSNVAAAIMNAILYGGM